MVKHKLDGHKTKCGTLLFLVNARVVESWKYTTCKKCLKKKKK